MVVEDRLARSRKALEALDSAWRTLTEIVGDLDRVDGLQQERDAALEAASGRFVTRSCVKCSICGSKCSNDVLGVLVVKAYVECRDCSRAINTAEEEGSD